MTFIDFLMILDGIGIAALLIGYWFLWNRGAESD